MIEAPTVTGDSAYRKIECRRAIEPPARLMLNGARTPFFDFASLLHAILPEAKAAGWQDDEVRLALQNIVADLRHTAR